MECSAKSHTILDGCVVVTDQRIIQITPKYVQTLSCIEFPCIKNRNKKLIYIYPRGVNFLGNLI